MINHLPGTPLKEEHTQLTLLPSLNVWYSKQIDSHQW